MDKTGQAEPSASDLAAAGSLAHLSHFLPYLEAEVGTIKKSITHRAGVAVRAGALTPDLAVQLWHEWDAADRLLRSFAARMRMTTSRATRAAPHLTLPPSTP